MPSAKITFRCYRCNKLLGAPQSRAGRVVTCPKCAAELIVPEPSEAPQAPPSSSAEAAVSAEDVLPEVSAADEEFPGFGPEAIRATPAGGGPPPPAPPPSRPVFEAEVEPSGGPAFPRIETAPISLKPEPPDYRIRPRAQPPEPDLATLSVEAGPVSEFTSLSAERAPAARRSDVVMPRSAVLLWSFYALAATVMAFVAGLLIGHFLWK